jgi:hypothetical protein
VLSGEQAARRELAANKARLGRGVSVRIISRDLHDAPP